MAIAFLIGLLSCTNNKAEKPKSDTNTFAIDTNQADKSVVQALRHDFATGTFFQREKKNLRYKMRG